MAQAKVIPFRRRQHSIRRTPVLLAVNGFALAGAVYLALTITPANRNQLATSIGLCASQGGETCVIDGDTIRLNGVKIRISDIDTPEISEPKCAREEKLGHRAKERLLILLNAGPFDVVATGQDKDRYGRNLRELHRNGNSLGDVLVEEGLAHRWRGRKESWC
jgi:endonuclease YncB( thermonuclease family)